MSDAEYEVFQRSGRTSGRPHAAPRCAHWLELACELQRCRAMSHGSVPASRSYITVAWPRFVMPARVWDVGLFLPVPLAPPPLPPSTRYGQIQVGESNTPVGMACPASALAAIGQLQIRSIPQRALTLCRTTEQF